MHFQDYRSLLSSIDQALAILVRNRSPDPIVIAAHDSLKQTKAMVIRSLRVLSPDPASPLDSPT